MTIQIDITSQIDLIDLVSYIVSYININIQENGSSRNTQKNDVTRRAETFPPI